MKITCKIRVILLVGIFLSFGVSQVYAVERPSPYWNETLTESRDFKVTVNGNSIFTEHFEIKTPFGPDITDRERNFVSRVYEYIGDIQRIAFSRFDISKGKNIIEVQFNKALTCKVRPIRPGMKITGQGSNCLRIEMPNPGYVQIDPEGMHPLVLIPEHRILPDFKLDGSNVLYFPPGVHHPGEIRAKSDQIIYIPAGAVVYGNIIADSCQNLRIIGNGILDTTQGEYGRCIHFRNCSNVLVDGLMLRSSKIGWMVVPKFSNDITYRNLKIIGFGTNNDGMDIVSSSNVTIENCYIRSTDDCIAVKTERGKRTEQLRVHGCTMNGYASSDGFTIGFEIRDSVRNIEVVDCDVLSGKGTNTSGGHAGFSIVCDGPGPISDIVFDNIRVDEVDYKNFELLITNGQHYVNMAPGRIENVTVRNVSWAREDMPFMIWGFGPKNKVRNVSFENCTLAGKPLTNAAVGRFIVNRYTDNIRFIHGSEIKMFRRF